MLGEYDFSEEKLRGALGIFPLKLAAIDTAYDGTSP